MSNSNIHTVKIISIMIVLAIANKYRYCLSSVGNLQELW
jgi:hypothetical protein